MPRCRRIKAGKFVPFALLPILHELQLTPVFGPHFYLNSIFIHLHNNDFRPKAYRKFFCVSEK
jgi:hypothetical protein